MQAAPWAGSQTNRQKQVIGIPWELGSLGDRRVVCPGHQDPRCQRRAVSGTHFSLPQGPTWDPACRVWTWPLPPLAPRLGTMPVDGMEVINSQHLFLAFSTAHAVSYRARHVLLC